MTNRFFEQIRGENDDLYYYVLPKNTLLYRGDTSFYMSRGLPQDPVFFSTTPEAVEQYGIVFEFQLKKELHLLALDNPETMKSLYEYARDEPQIQLILKRNYGYGYETRVRYSTPVSDKELTNYLCRNDFDGYATDTMITDRGTEFHKEIMVCNQSAVELVRQITTDSKTIASEVEKYKLRNVSIKKEGKKRSSKSEMNSPVKTYPISRSLFGDDGDDMGYETPSGGKKTSVSSKKRITRKKRQKRKRVYKSRRR